MKQMRDSVFIDTNIILYSYSQTEIEKYKYQYYDSLIIATAIENGCSILYSEDMQHNQNIENKLVIVNPFKEEQINA